MQMISPPGACDLCFTYNICLTFDAWQPLWIVLPGLFTFRDFKVKVHFNHQCVVWFSCSKMHLKPKKESK